MGLEFHGQTWLIDDIETGIEMILTSCFVFPQYWEKAEFPFECVPHIASLMVAGGTTKVCFLFGIA